MLNLVFDTSALISLEVAELMAKTAQECRCFLPRRVYEEIKELAKYEDVHGKAANRILKLDSITIKKARDISPHVTYVDEGEAAALELANNIHTDYLVCDDFESFWYLSENFENTVFSVFVVRYLCEENIISTEKGWTYIEKIRERRTWGDNILYKTAKRLWKEKEGNKNK